MLQSGMSFAVAIYTYVGKTIELAVLYGLLTEFSVPNLSTIPLTFIYVNKR